MEKKILLKVTNLKQYFPLKKQLGKPQLYVKANDGLSFNIYEGETLGLVGESGCGKSTLGRVLLQLYKQTAGKSMYYGRSLSDLAPVYVKRLINNAERQRQHARDLRTKFEEYAKEYEALGERERMEKHDHYAALEREAELSYMDIVQILGGFIVIEDLTEIRAALLDEWTIAHDLREKRQQENHWRIRVDGYGALNKKGRQASAQGHMDKCASEIAALEKSLRDAQRRVEALRATHAGAPGFAENEALRDSGIDLARLDYAEMRMLREDIQLIFQDPYSSLNPRMTVGQIIGEGLKSHKYFLPDDPSLQEYTLKTMDDCGLDPYFLHRYPHQFSGGQRQRIGIARALAMRPKFVVCDEAVSALDVSIQSQIINLLADMKQERNYTYLFISHDLSVVKHISDRIAVMYLGNIVELAGSEEIFSHYMHPYTEALLSSIPTTDVDSKVEPILLEGDIPSPIDPPPGCKFHTRCRYCTEICRKQMPDWVEAAPNHFVACHHPVKG